MKDKRLIGGDLDEVTEFLVKRITDRRGLWLVTLNFEMISRALRDQSYEDLLNAADFFIADGVPVAVYANWISGGRVGRVPGVDLVSCLLLHSRVGRVLVIGGLWPQGLKSQFDVPGREWLICDGKITEDGSGIDWLAIDKFGPEIIIVALGVPKQDWIALQLRTRVSSAVVIGVGGSVDFLTAKKRRAPRWVQRIGFEWLHRLITEPRRLARRYLVEYPAGLLRLLRRQVIRRAKT